jgi:hypothetical protein
MKFLLTWLCWLWCVGSYAQPSLVVILVRGGTAPYDLSGAEPNRAAWLLWKRVASPESAARVLGFCTGMRVHAEPDDALLLFPTDPYENGTAAHAFTRRTGVLIDGNDYLLAMNAGSLKRRDLLDRLLGARLEAQGKRGLYLRVAGSARPSAFALMAAGKQGYVRVREYPTQTALIQSVPFLQDVDWVLLEVEKWSYNSFELMIAEGIETWVISLAPPTPGYRREAMLSGVVRYQTQESRGMLTSPSTRWAGLITDLDIGPSLLKAVCGDRSELWRGMAGAPALAPNASGRENVSMQNLFSDSSIWYLFWNGWLPARLGKQMREEVGLPGSRSPVLQRISEEWFVQRQIAPLVLGTVAALGAVWMIGGMIWWRLGHLWRHVRSIYLAGLAVLSLFPVVTIWGSYCPFPIWTGDFTQDTTVICAWLMAGWSVLSIVAGLLAQRLRITLLTAAAIISIFTILLDLFLGGGYGIYHSFFGLYFWEGARLYGLDNNYAALLLLFGVLAPASWMEGRAREVLRGPHLIILVALYGMLVLAVGLPLLGANVGGTIAIVVALTAAGVLYTGKNLRPFHLLWIALLGLVLVAGFALVDSKLNWSIQSHIGRAWLQSVDGGNMLGLLSDKWKVITRVAVAPAMLITLLGMGLFAAGVYHWLREPIMRFQQHAVALRKGLIACFWGAVASVIFNDSGLVMACLIAGGTAVWTLEFMIGGRDSGYLSGNGYMKPDRHNARTLT